MARRKHVQSQHFCIARGLTRRPGTRLIFNADGSSHRVCESISRAKRFMRTGSESRS